MIERLSLFYLLYIVIPKWTEVVEWIVMSHQANKAGTGVTGATREPDNDRLPTKLEAGDRVEVDWSEGMGPVDTFTGEVVKITRSAGEWVVLVDCDEETYSESSIYGPGHDCAPEWLTLI